MQGCWHWQCTYSFWCRWGQQRDCAWAVLPCNPGCVLSVLPFISSPCPAAFCSLPDDSALPLVSSDMSFSLLSHPETDSAANESLDWFLTLLIFGKGWGEGHVKRHKAGWGASGELLDFGIIGNRVRDELERASVEGSSGLCLEMGLMLFQSLFALKCNSDGYIGF